MDGRTEGAAAPSLQYNLSSRDKARTDVGGLVAPESTRATGPRAV